MPKSACDDKKAQNWFNKLKPENKSLKYLQVSAIQKSVDTGHVMKLLENVTALETKQSVIKKILILKSAMFWRQVSY